MKKFNVNIDFKRGPSFSVSNIRATGKKAAEAYALTVASSCGYTEAFKRSTITEVAVTA